MDWVWSVWGWVWPTPFNANKFKVDLKTCIIRTNLHKLKQQEALQKEKGEVLELIRNGKTEMARIKVEEIIHHFRKISAYGIQDILTNYCESLSSRIDLLQTTAGDTPSEVLGAIHTIVYASLRLTIPELKELSDQIKGKFGYNIGDNTIESSSVWIDRRMIEYLSVDPPEETAIDKYMQEYYGQVESSEYSPKSAKSLRRSNSQNKVTPEEDSDVLYPPLPASQSYLSSPCAPPHFTHSAMPESLPGTPTPSSPYPSFSPSTSINPSPSSPYSVSSINPSPSTPPFPAPFSSSSFYTPSHRSPSPSPFPSPSPSPSPSVSISPPVTPLYPNPSSPLAYVDPSLLYNSPCTTYASAPFASPPPENPEFTAHEAASKTHKSSSHQIKKEPNYDASKKGAITPTRAKVSLKKVRPTHIRKARKSNPFQQSGRKSKQISLLEVMEYDDSSEEEHKMNITETTNNNNNNNNNINNNNTSFSDGESFSDISARLEALKKTNNK